MARLSTRSTIGCVSSPATTIARVHVRRRMRALASMIASSAAVRRPMTLSVDASIPNASEHCALPILGTLSANNMGLARSIPERTRSR